MPSKPTQRSLEELRKRGYVCGVTEKWNSFARVRQDYPYDKHGFGDIIAYHPNTNEVLAIQACADNGGAIMERFRKIKQSENAYKWTLQECRRLEIWGWGLRKNGTKRKVWTLRTMPISKDDFNLLKPPNGEE